MAKFLLLRPEGKILQFPRWDQRHLNKRKLSLQKEVISIRDGIRKATLFCSYNGHCSKVKIWSWKYWLVRCGCFRSLRHGSNSQRISRGKSLETLTQDVSSKRCIGFGKHDYENACKFLFRTLQSLGPSVTLSCLCRTLCQRESGNSGSKLNGQYERVTINCSKIQTSHKAHVFIKTATQKWRVTCLWLILKIFKAFYRIDVYQ